MKKNVVLLASLFMSVLAFAQNQNIKEIEVNAPYLKGEVFSSANEFIKNGVQYPAASKNAGLQGTYVIQFTVNSDGTLSEFNTVNSISAEIDEEVKRVLFVTNGKWTPGKVNGNPVAMTSEVSVEFKLNNNQDFIALAKRYLNNGNKLLFHKNNPKKALRHYKKASTLLPYEKTTLALIGLAEFELGNDKEAKEAWNRMAAIDANENDDGFPFKLTAKSENLKGYEELIQRLNG